MPYIYIWNQISWFLFCLLIENCFRKSYQRDPKLSPRNLKLCELKEDKFGKRLVAVSYPHGQDFVQRLTRHIMMEINVVVEGSTRLTPRHLDKEKEKQTFWTHKIRSYTYLKNNWRVTLEIEIFST